MVFVRPSWTKPRAYARLTIDGVWLLVLGILIGVHEYFVTASKLTTLPEGVNASQVVHIINVSFQIGFIVTAVIVVIQIVKQLQRLKRATPMPPDSMAARAAR